MSRRVAVVDLGSNSTRLLIADLAPDGTIVERERRSIVTRLGQGVDATGRLADEAMERVYTTLTGYREAIDQHQTDVTIGVLTSAVRDAANGAAFTDAVRTRFAIAARTIPGEEEARLTYLGATSDHAATGTVAVIDIGGGSTELVVGEGNDLRFHVSHQVGVVRHTERHLHDDPPAPAQLNELREDVAAAFAEHVPGNLHVNAAIAVAGTATQAAAMLDTTTLHRHELEALLDRLAALPLDARREVPGLDPDRAPTMVAGVAIMLEALAALRVESALASDQDILRGAVLQHTAFLPPHPQFSG